MRWPWKQKNERKLSTVGYLALSHKLPQDRGNELASELPWNSRSQNIMRTKQNLISHRIFLPTTHINVREPGASTPIPHYNPYLQSGCLDTRANLILL